MPILSPCTSPSPHMLCTIDTLSTPSPVRDEATNHRCSKVFPAETTFTVLQGLGKPPPRRLRSVWDIHTQRQCVCSKRRDHRRTRSVETFKGETERAQLGLLCKATRERNVRVENQRNTRWVLLSVGCSARLRQLTVKHIQQNLQGRSNRSSSDKLLGKEAVGRDQSLPATEVINTTSDLLVLLQKRN